MSVRKKRHKQKDQSPLSRVLASSNQPHVVRALFFDRLTAGEINHCVGRLANHPHFRSAIHLAGNDLSQFYQIKTPDVSLDKNIAWCLGLLGHYAEKVQFFLDEERRITQMLFSNDYEECLKLLDGLDAKCGDSLWSIGLRGAILALCDEPDAKRSFLNSLGERSGSNNFMKAIAKFVANRYEDTDLLSPEFHALEQKIKRSFEGDLLHFLMYKLVPHNFSFEYDFSRIVNFEKNSSLIDIYICLFDFACYSITANEDDCHFDLSKNIVKYFSRQYTNTSLRGLCSYFGVKSEWEFNETEYEILDLYTSGDYQGVCSLMQAKPALAGKFTLFEIWAKSASRTGTTVEGFIGELLQAACAVMLKNEKYEKAVASLLMRSNAFGMLPWFKELQHFITRETRFISGGKNEKIALASIALSEVDSPARSRAMKPEVRALFTAEMLRQVPSSLVVKLYEATNSDASIFEKWQIKGIEKFRIKKFHAKCYLQLKAYEKAIPLLIELAQQDVDHLAKNEAARLLVTAYISSERLEEAMKAYVATVMSNSRLLKTFDSDAICSVCEGMANESVSISVPISLSLHSRFVSDDYDAALRYSFERFLQNNNVQYPLDILGIEGIEKQQLNYFLEHVCVPDVMKLYLIFDTSKDIDRYRIEICKKLIELGHSTERMVYEVKERTRQLVILEATKHVEKSRIYADTSGLLTSLDFRKIFEKYTNLRSKDYSLEPDEVTLSGLFETVKNEPIIISSAHAIHIQDIILNEKNSTLLKLCKLMRDEFTFGVKGLNGHLSTRIRHGHFPNTIRKCVSDEGLFSPKIRATGGYKRADWVEKFLFLPEASIASIDKIFADFSSKYESLIEEVNDKWFQINVFDQDMSGLERGNITGEALFNYSTTAFEAYFIQRRIQSKESYDEFVKIITEWLWDRTDENLVVIQERINTEFRARAYRMLDSLEGDIFRVLIDQEKMSEFSDAVSHARTRLSLAIDSIISWFSKSQGLTVPMFDSEVAVMIASLSAGAKVEHSDTSGFQFQGRALSYLVDVLYVLLDNAVTKSNLQRDELEIITHLERGNRCTVLSVQNNCIPVSEFLSANDELAFYRNTYGEEQSAWKNAQGEGGSGFFKVWKALAKDLELAHDIEFGYECESKFKVSISFDNLELEKVRHHENLDN